MMTPGETITFLVRRNLPSTSSSSTSAATTTATASLSSSPSPTPSYIYRTFQVVAGAAPLSHAALSSSAFRAPFQFTAFQLHILHIIAQLAAVIYLPHSRKQSSSSAAKSVKGDKLQEAKEKRMHEIDGLQKVLRAFDAYSHSQEQSKK